MKICKFVSLYRGVRAFKLESSMDGSTYEFLGEGELAMNKDVVCDLSQGIDTKDEPKKIPPERMARGDAPTVEDQLKNVGRFRQFCWPGTCS